jgi:predicted Zn-dependent protease with MMP-like domain
MARITTKAVERIIHATLRELPEELRAALRMHGTLIEIHPMPPPDLEDTFGSFEGATFHELESPLTTVTEPPRIELYLSSFRAMAEEVEDWEEEVRLTVLHEIGHYLGLEEEDLEEI